MSANSWGLYRDRNTGRVGEYPTDAAAIFDNLEPVEDHKDDCVDCNYGYDDVADGYGFDATEDSLEEDYELDEEDEDDL